MAGLRKILHTERTSFQPTNLEDDDALSSGEFSPNGTLPQLPHMDNQTFLGIERQFEEFHNQFQTRTSRSLSAKRYQYIEAKAPILRTKRHVDLLQALFLAHRPEVSTPVTPTSLYNEDIADRNMQARNSNPYARIVSAIYQEDVADRNLRVNGCNISNSAVSRYNMRLRKMRSREERKMPRSRSQVANRSVETSTALRFISSDQDLRDGSAMGQSTAHLTVDENCAYLRPQSSAPSLSTTSMDGRNKPLPALPRSCDESDVRANLSTRTKPTATKEKPLPKKKAPPANNPPTNRLMSPNTTRSSTKNIHNLSINTKLAAPRKTFVRVGPRPANLQLPTPKKIPNVSLDEIVNSPLSVATPAPVSPAPPPKYNVEEIMDLFKQAYQTTENINPHPTFETLQDAIVREINSHDAFRQIHFESSTLNAPGLSPDLPSDEYMAKREEYSGSNRSSSRRSLSRHRYRHSLKPSPHSQRCNFDLQGRELSVAALKGMESDGIYTKKRRHTCSQPPSFELGRNYRSESDEHQGESRGRSARKRHSEVLYTRRSRSSRPLSSHSFFSKAVSSILDPPEPSTSTSGRSRSRISLRRSSSKANKLTKQETGDVERDDGIPSKPPPEIQVDHAPETQERPQLRGTFRVFPTSTPVSPVMRYSPMPPPVNPPKNKTKRAVWSTSPMSSTGKKRVPFRGSSIKKDL